MLIAQQQGSDLMETARLLALVNTAMSDAGVAIWESKYHYAFWRPVTGVRESDPGTGPSGLGDGNDDTLGDPSFSPLGAPASNLDRGQLHPALPGVSLGPRRASAARCSRRCAASTAPTPSPSPSSPTSSTASRSTTQGNPRPLLPRSFTSLSQAEEENGQSRIYLGIHWSFDKTEGIAQGRAVANYVFEHAFQPVAAGEAANVEPR